jgi:hypothetical protein
VDRFGDRLFGRSLRLRVFLWCAAQGGVFNQTQAARGVEYGSSGEVAKELERLVELGMLRKFGRTGRIGPQNYVREESDGWVVAGVVADLLHVDLTEHRGGGAGGRIERTFVSYSPAVTPWRQP